MANEVASRVLNPEQGLSRTAQLAAKWRAEAIERRQPIAPHRTAAHTDRVTAATLERCAEELEAMMAAAAGPPA